MLLKLWEYLLFSSFLPVFQKDSLDSPKVVSVLYCGGNMTKVK